MDLVCLRRASELTPELPVVDWVRECLGYDTLAVEIGGINFGVAAATRRKRHSEQERRQVRVVAGEGGVRHVRTTVVTHGRCCDGRPSMRRRQTVPCPT